ncbi:MAG TPA: hypothetical protein V6D26_20450 [Stenomitos sp.]
MRWLSGRYPRWRAKPLHAVKLEKKGAKQAEKLVVLLLYVYWQTEDGSTTIM